MIEDFLIDIFNLIWSIFKIGIGVVLAIIGFVLFGAAFSFATDNYDDPLKDSRNNDKYEEY